jgi:hypothetical protein
MHDWIPAGEKGGVAAEYCGIVGGITEKTLLFWVGMDGHTLITEKRPLMASANVLSGFCRYNVCWA